MTKKTTTKKCIPEFASVKEEAAFCGTYSTYYYEDEFKLVGVRFAKKLSESLTIRFDSETFEKVRAETHERGIGAITLIRMWILEHVKQHRKMSTQAFLTHKQPV